MAIRVEFYGIPRQRAGTSEASVDVLGGGAALRDVLREIGRRFPELAAECFDGDRLREGFALNVGGQQFVRDFDTRLRDEDSILLLSADAGG